jgi:thioredoxin 1
MVISVTEINQENLQNTITSNDLCLVDVYAPWCGPCKQLSPIIDEVSSETIGKVRVGKLNADDNMDFCKENNVRNIPTILLFKNGEVVERTTGLKSKKDILEMIEKHS